MITRTNAAALMREDVANEILQGVVQRSAVMQLARRLPNMSTKQRRLPVLSALPTAGFIDGDTGRKPLTTLEWGNKYLEAEELAVIVPIPEAVLDDTSYDVWGEVRPRIEEAMGLAFDAAVLFGTNKPVSWPAGIAPAAVTAGNSVQAGTGGDVFDDILGAGGVISLVEEDGFFVTGHVAARTMRARLRGLRDLQGQPIFMRTLDGGQNLQNSTRYELDGSPVFFPPNGAMDPDQALLISGDWSQAVYALRQDITYKVLDQAVLQDANGDIVYNLAQQDMVALRAVMRIAWQVANPISVANQNNLTRFPFAVLTPENGNGGGEGGESEGGESE